MFVSCDVIFHENIFPFATTNGKTDQEIQQLQLTISEIFTPFNNKINLEPSLNLGETYHEREQNHPDNHQETTTRKNEQVMAEMDYIEAPVTTNEGIPNIENEF